MLALKKLGWDPRQLGAIAFTHLHGDHMGGYPFLFLDSSFNLRRNRPLEIVGPVWVERRLREVAVAAYADLAHVVPPFDINFRELSAGGEVEILGAKIQGFAASHMEPPDRPLCLRITGADGKSVAFSGDTELCPGLFEAAEGVDLLVAECSGVKPPVGRHCTWEEWQPELPNLTAKQILFTHLGEDMRAALNDLDAPDNLQFADDGLQIEV